MRRTPWLPAFAVLLLPVLARAAGFDITWSPADAIGCWPENPRTVEHFACDTNSGEDVAVVSFALDQDMPKFAGLEAVLDLWSSDRTLPDWWQLVNSGSCRSAALSTSQDFTAATLSQCQDAWGSTVLICPPFCAPPPVAVVYQTQTTVPPLPGPYVQARLKVVDVFPNGDSSPLLAGVEYDAVQIHVRHDHTTGASMCGGCETPVALILELMHVVDTSNQDTVLGAPLQNGVIFWQSEVSLAAKNVTWGRIQSLYR